MKAMILAAGLGTRLQPLTKNKPKALVEIQGRLLLERLILRLKKYSFDEIIINTFHFAEQIHDFLKKNNNFDIRIEISHETELLDTGGGIKKAAWFFDDNRPFLVHNVDVLTDLDYRRMMSFHEQQNALATLAVRSRKTSRYFLFNKQNDLCGWESGIENKRKLVRERQEKLYRLSFMGIHVLSPRVFKFIKQEGKFSIIEPYLDLAADGKTIKAFLADEYRWLDLGRKENLDEAAELFSDILK